MIQIPVHNAQGEQVGTLDIDETVLGGRVRPVLLKQAYVRAHANRRQSSAHTRTRSEVQGSTRKIYRQKGTGNARHGSSRANLMRGGNHAHAKHPHSWRKDMPIKMRRLANRNALLAKAVDGEIKLVEKLEYDKPSTKQFAGLLKTLKIDRTCLLAVGDTRNNAAKSASNVDHISLMRVDHLNVFDVLNHHYLLADKQAFESYLDALGPLKKEAK